MFQGHVDQVFAALAALFLPPEEAATNHHNQQQQADDAQNVVRQPHRLFNATQRVHVAALGVGTGALVKSLHQRSLIHVQQLGIGTYVAAGKGVTRQLVEGAGFKVVQ
ncbi:hypothetical protein D3C75_1214860 [compost metagenome]